MVPERKALRVGAAFESNAVYLAEKTEYHIYAGDAVPLPGPCWYTPATPADPPRAAAFVLRNLENVTLDLGGAKLVFHGRILPFALYGCQNVTLKNFSVDYGRPFFTQGAVADVDEGSVTLEIPEAFPYRVCAGELIAVGEGWEQSLNAGAPLFQPYNASTMRLSKTTPMFLGVTGETVYPQENPPCRIYQLRAEALPGRRVRLFGTPEFFRPQPGEIVAFTHENRRKPGFLAENCENLTFENIRLLHIGAMAFMANLCRDLTFRNFSCYTDPETRGRIITVNADVLHGFHCTGRVLAENCRFESMLDDALNFHGNYAVCDIKTDAHTLVAENRGAELHHMQMFLPGDVLHVYRGGTQALKAVYTVVSADILPGNGRRMALSVREPLCDFAAGDIIENGRMPELVIRGCTAGRARGGWRISTGKRVLMENCRLENTPVMFTGDTDYWYENAPVRDVTLQNNEFSHFSGAPICAFPAFTRTPEAPYYHGGIKILHNRFTDCTGGILDMRDTRGITLRGNTYAADCSRELRLENCADVETDIGEGSEA